MPRLAVVLVPMILLASCGKVGAPLPPFIRIPERIRDLSASQLGNDVVLSWTNPARYVDGSAATDLEFVQIASDTESVVRIPTSGAGKPQSYSIPAQSWVGIDRKFTVWLETSRKKQSVTADVAITPVPVPGAVIDLHATLDQYSINVTWQPPVENRNLAERYFVRRLDRSDPPVLTQELQFKDSTFDRGGEYSYEVVAARQVNSKWIPGVVAPPVGMIAIDMKPPRPPSGVRIVVTDAGAAVTWDANEELDLAEYRVFRNGTAVSAQSGNFFFDSEYRPGMSYTISAVDESGNESGRSVAVPD